MKRLLFVLAACGDNGDPIGPDPGSTPATLEVFQNPLRVGEPAPVNLNWQFVDTAHAAPCPYPFEWLTCEPVTVYAFVIESAECDNCTIGDVDPAVEIQGFADLQITATAAGPTVLHVAIANLDHDRHRSLTVTTPAVAP